MHNPHPSFHSREAATPVLLLSLAALLLAGLHNVAHGFASVKVGASPWVHWASAAAVELGVAALALAISVPRPGSRPRRRLYIGVLLFVGASLFANYDASLESLTGGPVTWSRLTTLDPWTLAKAALLGGVIPLMVLAVFDALRDLVGVEAPVAPTKGAARLSVNRQNGRSPERAGPTPEEAERLLLLVDADPEASAVTLAAKLHISRATVYRWAESSGRRRIDGRWRAVDSTHDAEDLKFVSD
jgi:hypothetical protein